MRFKNYGDGTLILPLKQYVFPDAPGENHITLSLTVEPDELTQDFDPESPLVQLMLKAHPELRPFVLKTAWQKVLDEIL